MRDKYIFAIDCGGTNLRVAALDRDLNIIAFNKTDSIKNNPSLLYNKIKELLNELSKEVNSEIKNIGMSVCGVVTNNNVGRCANIGIEKSFDFFNKLSKDFPLAKVRIPTTFSIRKNDGLIFSRIPKYSLYNTFLSSSIIRSPAVLNP